MNELLSFKDRRYKKGCKLTMMSLFLAKNCVLNGPEMLSLSAIFLVASLTCQVKKKNSFNPLTNCSNLETSLKRPLCSASHHCMKNTSGSGFRKDIPCLWPLGSHHDRVLRQNNCLAETFSPILKVFIL